MLVAVGITDTGHRRVLGVSVALSEAEVHWRAFLDDSRQPRLTQCEADRLRGRGRLEGGAPRGAAHRTVAGCQCHLQQNAQAYVTRVDQRKPIARRIRSIFNAARDASKHSGTDCAIALWRADALKLAEAAEANLPDGFRSLQVSSGKGASARSCND